MIAILDYGSGNIRSAQRACQTTGQEVIVTSNRDEALSADGLVVPGVGAFAACMKGLRAIRGEEIIRERVHSKRPILGICVGLQILFTHSDEDQGQSTGVGIFPTTVKKLNHPVLPQIGWNTISVASKSKLFEGIEQERFYFVHSYAATETGIDAGISTSEYGSTFIAALETDSISAVQFHPEKSGEAGLTLLSNWAKTL